MSFFRFSLIALIASLLVGCGTSETRQLREELVVFGKEYSRLSTEREGDVDWNSIQVARDQFPHLATKIEERSFDVVWYAELDEDLPDRSRRVLAFDSFGPVRGGLVLFFDGSVKKVSANDFDKVLLESSQTRSPSSVELKMSELPYVETPVANVRLPLPDGARWNDALGAFDFAESKAVLHIQAMNSDFESGEMGLSLAMKQRDAKNIKKQQVSDATLKGTLYESSVFSKGSRPLRERWLFLLLSKGEQSILLSASLPNRSPRIDEFRECLLATQWTPQESE